MTQGFYEDGENTGERSSRLLRWAAAIVFVLALAFNWPYLTGGYYLDDFMLVNALETNEPPISPWAGAWVTTDVPAFDNLWWKSNDLTLAFWRPLPSLIIGLSTSVFGFNPLPLHGLSILMHALVSLAVFTLAYHLSGRRSVAFIAGLLFAVGEDHTITVSWISTLTDILCTLGVLVGLIFHLKYLRYSRVIHLGVSLAGLIGALACKETAAIGLPAAILMTALVWNRAGSDEVGVGLLRKIRQHLKERPLTWVPHLVVLAAYLLLYRLNGFGIDGSLQYIDPLNSPWDFALSSFMQLPSAWLGTLTIWPLFAAAFDPDLLPFTVVPGLAFYGLWLAGLWPFRRMAAVVWAMLVYLLALMPHMCTIAGERGLYTPMALGSILLAMPIMSVGRVAKWFRVQPITGSRWTRLSGWVLLIGALMLGTGVTTVRPWFMVNAFDQQEDHVRTAVEQLPGNPVEHLIVTNASDMMQTFYFGDILKRQVDNSPSVWLLAAAEGPFLLERTGDSSFVMRTDRAGWIDNTLARYVRTEAGVRAGQVYVKELFTAEVMETTAEHDDALEVRFEFDAPLEDERLCFLSWRGDRYERLDPDTIAVGRTVKLSQYRSIWETSFSSRPYDSE